jgi:hypothetical protein
MIEVIMEITSMMGLREKVYIIDIDNNIIKDKKSE